MQSYARPGMSMTSGHQATIAELRAMFQLKSWQGIYGRIQADIDASHRGHSSTPLTRGGLAHCWLTSRISVKFVSSYERSGALETRVSRVKFEFPINSTEGSVYVR